MLPTFLLSDVSFSFFRSRQVIQGVGGFSHSEWRSFTNERVTGAVPSHGFIDGNLVESLFDLPTEQQHRVAADLEMPLEELTRTIEAISRAIH